MNRHLVRRSSRLASILAAVASLASPALARTPPPLSNGGFAIPPEVDVPAPLRPWIGWVMHEKRDQLCPPLDGAKSDTVCEWPARLSLSVDDKGGRFTQGWSIRGRRARVELPGDAKRWPEDVRVDGKAALVIPLEGRPSVLLPLGDHLVAGAFLWEERPESLAVPKETGLVALTVSGRKVELPSRDADGSLWLQKEASKQEADVLEIVVHRLVDDDIPLQLVTRIQLRVSGHSREVVLGRALPEGFIPMSLDSPLPARVEPDSRLRVQVRPGTFQITLTARHEGPVSSLSRPAPDGPWKEGDEVWAFRAHPDLRVVTVEGVNSIDPQQTLLPDDWKRLPTYPVKQGDTVTLVEHQRGDADPAPDSLSLSRILWLDFDGGGFTASDHISGTLHRAWRLEMNPPSQLGRVAVGGVDQFITAAEPDEPSDKSRAKGPGRAGVEIRQGSVELYAESRLAGGGTLPAVSWDADFHDVSGTLHLPPGWRLLSASGADEVGNTWIGRWSLLDFFLGLIIAMAVARLYGLRWGALALFALTLALPEGEAPRFSWLYVLAAEALVRLLPAGKLSTAVRVVRLGARIGLVLFVVTFAAQHLRFGLYPALAGGEAGVDGEQAEATPEWLQRTVDGKAGGRGRAAADGAPGAPAEQAAAGSVDEPSGGSGGVYAKVRKGAAKSDNNNWTNEYDPNAMVQTGPGRPRWSWSTVPLRWTGPVERTQTLRLLLLPPWLNLLLALVRVLLLSALVLRLFDSSRPLGSGLLRAQQAMRFALFVFVGLALYAGPARADDPETANGANGTNPAPNTPANAILDELQRRLLQPAECRPNCASSPRLLLEATPNLLRLRMEIDAAAPVGVPLPGTAGQWEPETVLLDGKPASALMREDGKLWIAVGEGSHQVVLEGALPARDTVQIALPEKSHRVTAKTDGWRLDGLHEDGVADDDLQLTRVRDRGGAASALQPGSLPPLVRVERQITLGLVWQVETKVVRVTPTGSAVVLEVPLLPGESVTTDDVRVAAGKALVNIAPGETEVSWRSQLKEVSALALSAPKTSQWIEVWRLEVSPIWHVAIAGVPVVGQGGEANLRRPEWHPWPGESVTLSVSRPKGIAGQTLTIDHSALSVSPGLRATDTTLAIDLRASRGGQHTIVLPESAAIQSLIVDGRAQPIRQDKGRLTLPLVPGSQHVIVAWRQPDPIATRFRSPSVDLGAPSVNVDLCIELANDRWVLLAGGPRLGPAVLFWSLILLLAMVSAALGKVRWTPLRFHHWLLLGLGLSQVLLALAMLVAGWLLLIGWRHERPGQTWESRLAFNARQLLLVAATASAVFILLVAIREGLLGRPDMQVSGNGSDAEHLRWFQDRTTGSLPHAWALSVPLWVYRVAMLLWALWLARALLEWMRWGWTSFGLGGLWRKQPPKARPAVAPAAPPVPPSTPTPEPPLPTT